MGKDGNITHLRWVHWQISDDIDFSSIPDLVPMKPYKEAIKRCGPVFEQYTRAETMQYKLGAYSWALSPLVYLNSPGQYW